MDEPSTTRYSIREVSELTGVPAHTLRFWEKALQPMLQPYRTPGGQRRYDDGHLSVIREVHRRVSEEHQSLAAVRHTLIRRQAGADAGQALSGKLLEDPTIQQALDDIAEALKLRVLRLLDAVPADASGAAPAGSPGQEISL